MKTQLLHNISRFMHFSQVPGEPAVQESARATEKEDIHYGEIDLSKWRPEPTLVSAQDSRQQQDTMYAQVRVSKTENSLTQTFHSPESIYAQVKNK